MICIHHNKDLDGYASGAVVRRKYPDCTLIGWDYKDEIPWEKFPTGEPVVMIDISFPMEDLIKLSQITFGKLTLIDHHISKKRDFDACTDADKFQIKYVYEDGIAACEIGWKHFFPNEPTPLAIRLLGEYDTWRNRETSRWEEEILPFQFYMRAVCYNPETFPPEFFSFFKSYVENAITHGKYIVKFQEVRDMLNAERSSFQHGIRGHCAICLNTSAFSSDTLKSVYDPTKHDLMVGLEYTGHGWIVSLRSDKPDIDVSEIAKTFGGGGHKSAAGFGAEHLDEIFDQVYCPKCGACGEDPCCSGAHCQQMRCYYGETYKHHYIFSQDVNRMTHELMDKIEKSKIRMKDIVPTFKKKWDEIWDKVYKREGE